MKLNILLVDDDPLAIRLLRHATGPGHNLKTAANSAQAMEFLSQHNFDFALIDLNLAYPLEGLKLIGPLKKNGAMVVVTSAHEEEDIITQCYEEGCDAYYAKGDLSASVGKIVEDVLRRRLDPLPDSVFENEYVTTDDETKASARALLRGITSGLNGLILGPTGTGKTELARLVHKFGGFSGDLVELNCAGLPKDLIEAELFGHEKGSFTGADKMRVGKFKLADKGVLFLDEIGSLPLEAQPKLLKILEEKVFYPVGGDVPVRSDFRIIAATNEDLFALAAKGLFRLDLLQRLCGTVIQLKPLSRRTSDIFPLIKIFNTSPKKLFFLPDAKDRILAHNWMGNLRELKNFVDHCLAAGKGVIDASVVRSFINRQGENQESHLWSEAAWKKAMSGGLDDLTDEFRTWVIRKTLEHNGGNVTRTMKALSISSRQYYNHLPRPPKARMELEEHVVH